MDEFKGYFIRSYAYIGNVRIDVYDHNGNLIHYTIDNDYNEIGYCNCLTDLGYEDRGWI